MGSLFDVVSLIIGRGASLLGAVSPTFRRFPLLRRRTLIGNCSRWLMMRYSPGSMRGGTSIGRMVSFCRLRSAVLVSGYFTLSREEAAEVVMMSLTVSAGGSSAVPIVVVKCLLTLPIREAVVGEGIVPPSPT